MLRKQLSKQHALVYSEDIYKELIPKDHFLYQVNENVDFSFANDLCRHLYSKDEGRPVENYPERMLRAEFVQTYYDLSDRRMKEEANLHMVVKWFLKYNVFDEAFDHSALSQFRKLAGPELHKQMFDNILDQLVAAGLVKKDETQFIDATHSKANVHILTALQLIFRTVLALASELEKASGTLFQTVAREVDLNKVLPKDKKGKRREPSEYHLKEHEKRRKFAEMVLLARNIIAAVRTKVDELGTNLDAKARQKVVAMVDLLERVLRENVEESSGPDGKTKITKKKGPVKDRIVSPVDPDCRHGAKSDKKKFTGYKTTFTGNKKGIITGVDVDPGNHDDGASMAPMVDEMEKEHGLVPKKMGGDKAYGSGGNRRELAKKGIQVVAPLKEPSNSKGKDLFTVDRFMFDPMNNTVTCLNGQTTSKAYYNRFNKNTMYHFSAEICGPCPYKKECTNAAFRTLSISDYYREFQEAKDYNKTDAYKDDMDGRKGHERLNSEAKGQHGLRRAKYWGRAKMRIQAYLVAIVINAKRLVKWVSVSVRRPLGKAV